MLFRCKGYEATSVDEICVSANLAKGTFYQHFDSKIDVLYALTGEAREDGLALAQERLAAGVAPLEIAREMFLRLAQWFEDHRPIARPLLVHAITNPRGAEEGSSRAMLAMLFAEAQKRGEIRTEFDAHFLAVHLVGGVVPMTLHWAERGLAGQLVEWYELAWKLYLEGARTR